MRCCCRAARSPRTRSRRPRRPVLSRSSSTGRCRPARSASTSRPASPSSGFPAASLPRFAHSLAAGIPVTVAIGDVQVASREAGGSIAAFSSRGLVLDGGLKPSLAAPGVSVPTSEPGRGDDGEVRFGTLSGTSAAAAVTAGVAAVLAQGRPALSARGLQAVLVGSAQRADLDPTASGAGVVDLRAAVQQEVFAEPSLISFGVTGTAGAERVLRLTNVSTRAIVRLDRHAPRSLRRASRSPSTRSISASAREPAPTSSSARIPRISRRRPALRPASSSCAQEAHPRSTSPGPSRCRPMSTSSRGWPSR